jgi:predicted Rossmann fold flavoprotein
VSGARRADIAVVGAGAAGLFAAIWAGRTLGGAGTRPGGAPGGVLALDGAARLGAKILVAGGGRCNVTHWQVDERDYAGSSAPAIRKVLRRFGVDRTVAFFAELGVELKREETGKLFPVTDDAHTVLDALLGAARAAGAELAHPDRVRAVAPVDGGFAVESDGGLVHARRVVLCTGGKALPKSGSDGAGLEIARSLGHSVTDRLVPALVPLRLAEGHWIRALSGLTVPAELVLRAAGGRRIAAFADSTLCTHFGLSGPSVLNISRHWTHAHLDDPGARLELCWLPGLDAEQVDAWLVGAKGRAVGALLRERVPERLARALCDAAGVDPAGTAQQLPRDRRRALAQLAAATPLPVEGDRGYTFAEATAGGVPLAEVRLETMESRVTPGLHLAGEVLDVDGRIGGFNFQWAWASGFVAGSSAAEALSPG